MKKLKQKHKRYLAARAHTEAKKRKKRNKLFRKKRITQNLYLKSYKYQKKLLKEKERLDLVLGTERPNPEFSLLKNINNVIQFINRLKRYAKETNKEKFLYIELDNVTKIDIGAICMLLSVVEELTYFGVYVEGTIPDDKECRQFFIDSGFLAHMKVLTNPHGLGISPNNKNLILKVGQDKTKNQEVGEAIQQAMELITGEKKHYQPIYSIIQEINGNSVEHAYDKEKEKEHWLLGINHDVQKKKVIFTFADNGFGILKTLNRKFSREFFDNLRLQTNSDILKGAFNKKYSSRHRDQSNRNKGLPLLKKIQSKGQVKNLLVITNDVSLQIEKENSIALDADFSGTFYYWELDYECINNGRKDQI